MCVNVSWAVSDLFKYLTSAPEKKKKKTLSQTLGLCVCVCLCVASGSFLSCQSVCQRQTASSRLRYNTQKRIHWWCGRFKREQSRPECARVWLKLFQNTFLKGNSSTTECSTAWVRFKVTLPHDCADRWWMLETQTAAGKTCLFYDNGKDDYVWKMDFLNDDLSPSRLMFGYVFACSVRDRYIWAALFDVLVNTQVLRFPQRDH